MTVRGVIYYNRSSGEQVPELAARLQSAANAAGVDLVTLEPNLDIGRDIRERIAGGERLFIAAGGDGTINHVAQPLVGTDARLGVIPVGTFNHFARDIG
ncbi:MAG TPA: acylglycerol kinase family protein, partial [Thermoanaerobaculia bacterium]|nr:acylglycerol kinase family protein [Thermoanaerobaculia bacterium]